MKSRYFLRPVLVFLAAVAFCGAFMPWHSFPDPDGFYHAKISNLVWQHGPLKSFSWLDLTLMGSSFADLHFLFHAIVAPFTAVFGSFVGLRLASTILAALFFVAFEACLRRLKLPYPLLWTGVLITTQPLLFRVLLSKATPLALLLFIVGLTMALLRKPVWVCAAAAVFALSHGGWLYLAGSVVLLAAGQIMYLKVVEDKSWREACGSSLWREVAAGFLGGLAGMLVHPNFPQDFVFSWTQVFTIGLATPFEHVSLGLEWSPSSAKALFTSYAPWVVFGLVGISGIFAAPRRPLDRNKAQLTVSLGLVLAVLFALTLKSRRNTEYLAPIVAMTCAALWSHVDVKKLYQAFKDSFRANGPWAYRYIIGIVSVLAGLLLIRECGVGWASLHEETYADDVYRGSMAAISHQAESGDRVFHSSWDEFPMLFAADDRLRYVSGLDPTFLYVASSTLSDDVKNLTSGSVSSTREQAWELIHDRLGSKFVFISKGNHADFLKLIQSDKRYVNIADFPDSAAFRLKEE